MYSVIRFTANDVEEAWWRQLGEKLEVACPDAPWQLRRSRADGIAVELCDDDEWQRHRDQALAYVQRAEAAITEARRCGVQVCLDVAIEPGDLQGTPVLGLGVDAGLMSALLVADVALEFSVYATTDSSAG